MGDDVVSQHSFLALLYRQTLVGYLVIENGDTPIDRLDQLIITETIHATYTVDDR